jgi:hypothetical protein
MISTSIIDASLIIISAARRFRIEKWRLLFFCLTFVRQAAKAAISVIDIDQSH